MKTIKIFREKFIENEPVPFVHCGKYYFPAIYQDEKNLNLLYLKKFNGKFDKFNKDQIIRITGISELDLNVAARKDLRGMIVHKLK